MFVRTVLGQARLCWDNLSVCVCLFVCVHVWCTRGMDQDGYIGTGTAMLNLKLDRVPCFKSESVGYQV